MYDRLETFGANLVALGQKALRLAQDADPELPRGADAPATHTPPVRYDQGSRAAGYAASDASETGFHRGTPKNNETPRTLGDETPTWASPRRAW